MQKTQLALFPLQLFLLPGETFKLHIFEERYRQLLADCESVQISFGIPYTEDGTLSGYGSLVQLKRVLSRKKNGSADIEVEAIGIFKVKRFFLRLGEKLYPGGDVEIVEPENGSSVGQDLLDAFNTFLAKSESLVSTEAFSANLGLFDVARMLKLEDSKKINLLKLKTKEERERFLLSEIKLRLLLLKQMNSVEHNIYLN